MDIITKLNLFFLFNSLRVGDCYICIWASNININMYNYVYIYIYVYMFLNVDIFLI